jgi:hypothetical protein
LIQAINEANANGQPQNTIRLAPGTYTLTDIDNQTDGPDGLPSITSRLTIRVVGSGMACIERATTAPDFRVLHVSSNGDLTDGIAGRQRLVQKIARKNPTLR